MDTTKAKVFALHQRSYKPGMFWPAEFVGSPQDAHKKALKLSRLYDVTVDFGDRVVSYVNGQSQLS